MFTKFQIENMLESSFFLGTLTAFLALSVYFCIHSTGTISVQENRSLANFPEIHSWRKDIAKFPTGFEQFFKDRIPLRLPLIFSKNYLTYKIFNTSSNPLVVIGKQNWLFYKSYGITPAQLNLGQFNDDDLQDWVRDIQARRDFLSQNHIKYLLVIAPEKGSMYPELLPDGWIRHPGPTRLEQLQTYLLEHTNIEFIDAHEILSTEKTNGRKTYHSNDTHWNQRSAFLISQDILKKIHESFGSVEPVNSKMLLNGHDNFTGDLAKMLVLPEFFTDTSPSIVVNKVSNAVPVSAMVKLATMGSQEPAFATQVKDSSLPRTLVLRDSFCTYLTAPLSEHFSFAEYQWTNDFQPDAILAEKPDVVINEIAERHLFEEFHEHVPVFASSSTESSNPICTFGDTIQLEGLSARQTLEGLTIKLNWRSKKASNLDYTVGVHCLDSHQRIVCGADYQPDIIKRHVDSQICWSDKTSISNKRLKNTANIGISIYYPGKSSMSCDSPQANSNTIYFSLKELEAASTKTESTVADRGVEPAL